MEKNGLFKGKIIFVLVALIFALIGTSLFVGNRQIKIANEITVAEDLTGPTESTEGYWTDAGRRGDSFAGGDGLTEETAYEIATAEQLAYLACSVNNGNSYSGKYFKQTADIDLSKYYWKPIGDGWFYDSTRLPFSGNYDGANYTISGIFTPSLPTLIELNYINNPDIQRPTFNQYYYQGLFGCVSGNCYLKNINVTNSYIIGLSYVGGIAGDSSSSTGESLVVINNCHFSGRIKGYSYVGGIVGNGNAIFNCSNSGNVYSTNYTCALLIKNWGFDIETGGQVIQTTTDYVNYETAKYVGGITGKASYIKNSCNSGSVNGVDKIGGIAGYTSEIINSYNIGSITGDKNVGGIVGESVYVSNCYNAGILDSDSYVGGIAGCRAEYTDSYIVNSFSISTLDSLPAAGGILGYISSSNEYDVQILNCYYSSNDSLINSVYEGTVIFDNSQNIELTSNAVDKNWYLAEENWCYTNEWNFDYIWEIDSDKNNGLPVFQGPSSVQYWTDEDIIGNYHGYEEEGTKEDPYLIEDAYDLAYLAYTVNNSSETYNYVDKYFKQTADIDLSEYYWQPIGYGATMVRSMSDYDLQNTRAFSGNYDGDYYAITGINNYVDLIDYDETKEIFEKFNNQGLFGIVIDKNSFTIEIKNIGIKDSKIEGYINVGAIVGQAREVVISNCYNYADVIGNGFVGGIAGGRTCIIYDSFNSGNIYLKYDGRDDYSYAGGIAGDARSIYTSFNSGTIEDFCYVSAMYVAGISGTHPQIVNCFNAGSVRGYNAGGLCGYLDYPNLHYSVSSSYNVGEVYGFNTSGDVGPSSTEQTDESLTIDDFKSINIFKDTSYWQLLIESQILIIWDFETTWEFREGENDGFPVLMVYRPTYWRDYRAESFSGGDGKTPETAFEISSAEELALLAYEVNYGSTDGLTPGNMGDFQFFGNVYFKQTCDIDLSEHVWEPIGYMNVQSGDMHSFAGNYDGQNYKVFGVYTEMQNYAGGLFGMCFNDATRSYIKNIVLLDSNINATTIASGICAYFSNYEISNCINYAKVNSYGMAAGGVAGGGMNSDVINCLNFGEVNAYSSSGMAGGVAALIMEGNILNCGNEGIINGTTKASICASASCVISNCYSISNDEMILANGGTISNCLYINSDGKFYVGATDTEGNNITSFAEFAWINENSCPIPKSLTWLGQYFTQDITELITSPDSGWINVAA